MVLPIAYLGFLTWPIWWLMALPNDVRCRVAVRGAVRDLTVTLHGVVRLREYTCTLPSFASFDEDCYYELRYGDGARCVILDNTGDLQRRLTERGIAPSATFRFADTSPLLWFFWLITTGATIILAIFLYAICC
jgi:hypothetical protein